MRKNQLFELLKKSNRPVIVDFWAPWCGPCRAMEPAIHQVSSEFESRVKVIKVNSDESQELLQELHIFGIPTMIGFVNGEEIARKTGAQRTETLRAFFDAIANGRKPVRPPLALRDRLLRVGAGLVLAIAGWLALHSYLLVGLGAILLFSAVYDRCPIYQAVAPRIKTAFRSLMRS